ncbi:MAG: uncharacterized protein A8A55_1911 [Amphiamblys sp. WSBS2006]|nr:MAG: uncharacterized protein A8A55_1911 [Amphiamblys sp. WSBS2006]
MPSPQRRLSKGDGWKEYTDEAGRTETVGQNKAFGNFGRLELELERHSMVKLFGPILSVELVGRYLAAPVQIGPDRSETCSRLYGKVEERRGDSSESLPQKNKAASRNNTTRSFAVSGSRSSLSKRVYVLVSATVARLSQRPERCGYLITLLNPPNLSRFLSSDTQLHGPARAVSIHSHVQTVSRDSPQDSPWSATPLHRTASFHLRESSFTRAVVSSVSVSPVFSLPQTQILQILFQASQPFRWNSSSHAWIVFVFCASRPLMSA